MRLPRLAFLRARRRRARYGRRVAARSSGRSPVMSRSLDQPRLTLPFDVTDAKLQVPVARPGIVERATLVDRLLEAPSAPVGAVVAPSGYGKTTLQAKWARR